MLRTAPNKLSFSSAASWKDIYGFRQGHQAFVKSPFYNGGTFADVAHSIVSERGPVTHGEMMKHLSHAFSERSLKDQEDLVSEVVDDIIGSLASGTSFGGLTSGADENGLETAQ